MQTDPIEYSETIDESKKIDFGFSFFLIIGTIIGSMAWLIYSPMIAKTGIWACILSWPIAGLMVLPLLFCVAELSSMFPRAGGPYIYIKEMFNLLPSKWGEPLAFLGGWTYWLTFVVGVSLMLNGLTDLIQRMYVNEPIMANSWSSSLVILFVLVVSSVMNLYPIKNISLINAVLTGIKIFILVSFWFFFVCFMPSLSGALDNLNVSSSSIDWQKELGGVFPVLAFALGAFAGIEGTGCIASETKNAQKTVPKVILSVVPILIVLYFVTALVVCSSANYVAIENNSRAVIESTKLEATIPDIAVHLGGVSYGNFYSLAVIFSICACTIPALLYGARVLYSVAKESLGNGRLSQIHSVTSIPRNAVLMQLICMVIVSIPLNLLQQTKMIPNAFGFLGESFGFLYGALCILYAFALISMRRGFPEAQRPFKIWGKGNLPAYCLASFVILTFSYTITFNIGLENQILAITLIIAGVPVYFKMRKAA